MIELHDAFGSHERLAPELPVLLPRADVYSNAVSEDTIKTLARAYAQTSVVAKGVDFGKLPSGTLVRGDDFATAVDGELVKEQLGPEETRSSASLSTVVPGESPTVLIARYGDGTWGHWLGELLPKAALIERCHPGAFLYAVPARIVDGRESDLLARRVSEAFLAYGIGADRLVPLRGDCQYSFTNLHAVTSVWSDRILHPVVSQIMCDLDVPYSGTRNVALVRSDTRRSIRNVEDVMWVLESSGFRTVEVASLSFLEQVGLFKSSRTIFSVLGSTLSGLIFSPEGVRVVATAPDQFLDTFFYGLIQAKYGRYAEIRGPAEPGHVPHYRDNSFEVPTDDLRTALRIFRDG